MSSLSSTHVAAGYFVDPSDAKRALEELASAGFAIDEISLVLHPGANQMHDRSDSALDSLVGFFEADMDADEEERDHTQTSRQGGPSSQCSRLYEPLIQRHEELMFPDTSVAYLGSRFRESEKGIIVLVATRTRQTEASIIFRANAGTIGDCEGG